jgi:hypothetical protein
MITKDLKLKDISQVINLIIYAKGYIYKIP